jgi:hypothetical protein
MAQAFDRAWIVLLAMATAIACGFPAQASPNRPPPYQAAIDFDFSQYAIGRSMKDFCPGVVRSLRLILASNNNQEEHS